MRKDQLYAEDTIQHLEEFAKEGKFRVVNVDISFSIVLFEK